MKALGIVGLDGRARKYVDYFNDQGHSLVGTDRNEEAKTEFEDRFDIQTTDSISALLEYPLDGVVVTTENRYHQEHAEHFLDAGIDVLVHKPLAHTLESAREIERMAAAADATCTVGYPERCRAVNQWVGEQVRNGYFGSVYYVEAQAIRPRTIPALGNWYTSRDISGGGAFMDVGAQYVDTFLHYFGFPAVADVSGVIRQSFDPAEYEPSGWFHESPAPLRRSDVEDSATALIELENDCSVSIDAHWAANQPFQREIRIFGDRLGATLDLEAETISIHDPDDRGYEPPAFEAADWQAVPATCEAFLRAIDGAETPLTTPAEAVRIQEVVERLYYRSTI